MSQEQALLPTADAATGRDGMHPFPSDMRSSPHRSDTTDHASETDSLHLGPAAMHVEGEEDGDISVLQDNIIKQSRTIDDFTRIIADWRNEREKRQKGDGASQRTSFHGGTGGAADGGMASTSALGARGLQIKGSALSLRRESEKSRLSLDVDTASQYSYEPSSVGDPDDLAASASASPTANLSPLALHSEGTAKNVRVRCTCCCGRGTRRCKRARRATREWSEVESDLRLAAEIGQALLRRNDSLQSEMQQNQQEYSTRIDSLMKKLSSSIREASQLERQREQSELNLEAADASNRSLVRELDDCRRELTRLRSAGAKNLGLESRLERLQRELGDTKQELGEERKKGKKMERMCADVSDDLRIARIEGKRQTATDEDRARRREEMKTMAETRLAASASSSTAQEDNRWAEGLVAENEQLEQENRRLREMLEARAEELGQMREEWSERLGVTTSSQGAEDHDKPMQLGDLPVRTFGALSSEIVQGDSSAVSQSTSKSTQSGVSEPLPGVFLSPVIASQSTVSSAASITSADTTETTVEDGEGLGRHERSSSLLAAPNNPPSTATHKSSKENRTAQLTSLIEMVQRIFGRLSNADVETLSKRLQKQNLTGDVGHLARTTVNAILRDVEGLREHFRRGMEAENRNRDADSMSMGSKNSNKSERESDSLVAKKEFFGLIKTFKELFVEMARLRKVVNEVSLQPQNAARILQEHLGVNASEDKGMGGWIGRLFSATPLPGGAIASGQTAQQPPPVPSIRPSTSRVTSGPQLTTRASAAVLSSAVAVEVKGSHASEQQQQQQSSSSDVRAAPPPIEDAPPSHARPFPIRNQRSLSRTQSRNLSGLFVGSRSGSGHEGEGGGPGVMHNDLGSPNQARTPLDGQQSNSRYNRLSRIVDDDEVSIHHSFTPKRGRRPRNLSDSSIRTTYLEEEDKLGSGKSSGKAPTAISRIITPSTLSLQASSFVNTAVVQPDSAASRETTRAPDPSPPSGFLSGIAAPRSTVSKALSFLSGPNTAPQPPPLRAAASSARLSLAAASTTPPIGMSDHAGGPTQSRTGSSG